MSLHVHLVRHCAHADVGVALSGRRAGLPLTEAGLLAAHGLGRDFADARLIAVQSSPRERAMETAAAIAEGHGLAVEAVDALDEIDFGEWQGRRFDALNGDRQWREWNEARASARPPGGETMAAAVTRIAGHLDALARSGEAGEMVCVSHCDMIRGAVAHYLGLSLDHLLRFDVDPGSVTTLYLSADGTARLVTLNRRCA